ncbi:MAG: hypothetical protein RJA25_1401 [Bacteroidota bacterium]|jgi:uncharacterized protein (DUF3820 family)
MTTKLTLTIEKSIIERSKKYAKHNGRSLSDLVEKYLNNITQDDISTAKLSKLKKIVGAVKLPENFDEKKELSSYYEMKHL